MKRHRGRYQARTRLCKPFTGIMCLWISEECLQDRVLAARPRRLAPKYRGFESQLRAGIAAHLEVQAQGKLLKVLCKANEVKQCAKMEVLSSADSAVGVLPLVIWVGARFGGWALDHRGSLRCRFPRRFRRMNVHTGKLRSLGIRESESEVCLELMRTGSGRDP